jgi:hypothetical protein|tara:strand:- start:194 stop:442 length:249 start_codon:yes stop_codon:yes gene_type:complete
MKHADIIKIFGGVIPLQKALGHRHPTTVRAWQAAGKIPAWRWGDLLRLSQDVNAVSFKRLDPGDERRSRRKLTRYDFVQNDL